MLDRIDIPESALEDKPWFYEFPGESLIKEIRDFVAQTGKPYLWRGHSHSTPLAGADIRYVEEFSLPKSCKAQSSWSPCPCCTPFTPKFRDGGKIAWFPVEKLIRLIGPRCYRTLNQAGHDDAVKDLRRRRREKKDVEYILKQTPHLPKVRAALEGASKVARAADAFFPALKDRIEVTLRVRLWNSIRSGELSVNEELTERYVDKSGKEQERRVINQRRYATMRGVSAIDPSRKTKADRIDRLIERLETALAAIAAERLDEMKAEQRHRLARAVSRIVSETDQIFLELRAELDFLKPENFQTLRTWARMDAAPVKLFIERETDAIVVGRRAEERVRVPFSTALRAPIPTLPKQARVVLGDLND